MSLRVLRVFLGVTFVYAGVQKLADPGFLHAGSPDFIGSQLRAFAQGSPMGWMLRLLDHSPALAGVGIALVEIVVGIGTLAGVAPIVLAATGFLVNLVLTLTATWHVHPYFLGSDSMYAVGWLAYLAGLVEAERRARHATVGKRAQPVAGGLTRREFVRGAALAGATLATAGAASALAGSAAAAPRAAADTAVRPSSGGARQASQGPSVSDASGSSGARAAQQVSGTPIADLSRVPVGGAVGFQAPGVGPAALVRVSSDEVVAYSRVCTHAGCLVGYDSGARLLVCPCHGAEFDPARGAVVVAGPAPRPLEVVDVAVDPSTGQVVLPG